MERKRVRSAGFHLGGMKVEMVGDGAANKRVGLELCKNMEIWRHGQSGRGLLGG